MMEWIDGEPVRRRVNEWLAAYSAGGPREPKEGGADGRQPAVADSPALTGLMRRIGTTIGGLHAISIVHGDLTTSNMMLRPRPDGHGPANGHNAADALLDGDVVLIDFGLASQSTHEEDRAVDLYVLERAFGSTHPKAEVLFSAVLDAYRETFKAAPAVLRRLEDVRLRGRKRSMIG